MNIQDEVLSTGRGGRLHGVMWTPDQRCIRGVVIAVHGLGDHSQRFASIAEDLCEAGWPLFAFDIEGHGRSPGTRGKINSYDGLLADIAAARRTARERLGELPQVLLGHSMGGNVVLNYALRSAEFDTELPMLSGVVLVSPMILPANPPQRPHIFAAWLTGHLFPWLTVGKPVDKAKLSSDPQTAAEIVDDSLTHTQISIHLATQLLAQGRWAIDHAREINVPTLIMHGDDDELIDQSACEHLAVRIGESAEYVRWAGMRHALLHDVDRQRVIQSLVDWLSTTFTTDQ